MINITKTRSALIDKVRMFAGAVNAGAHSAPHPFRVMVNKEIRDHVRSWRFLILLFLILLTCMGSLYTSVTNLSKSIKPNDPQADFLF
ncbi:hypothetical protein [Arcticibacter sp. MXS-1]|uniref:hypothetical protein n=1 Tax=Arcticibacter sp. MXS-1 TaxID=3341726 RepID=UPI0035A829FD